MGIKKSGHPRPHASRADQCVSSQKRLHPDCSFSANAACKTAGTHVWNTSHIPQKARPVSIQTGHNEQPSHCHSGLGFHWNWVTPPRLWTHNSPHLGAKAPPLWPTALCYNGIAVRTTRHQSWFLFPWCWKTPQMRLKLNTLVFTSEGQTSIGILQVTRFPTYPALQSLKPPLTGYNS